MATYFYNSTIAKHECVFFSAYFSGTQNIVTIPQGMFAVGKISIWKEVTAGQIDLLINGTLFERKYNTFGYTSAISEFDINNIGSDSGGLTLSAFQVGTGIVVAALTIFKNTP